MGAKDISKTLTLKDGTSGTLSKVSAGTVRYKKTLHDLKRQGNDTWTSLGRGIAGVAAAIAGYVGLRSLISFSNDFAEVAKGQIEVETKLAVVMRQRMGANDEMIKSVVDLTNAQEQLGVVAYDAQIAGAQELGTYLEQASTLKSLIPSMNNLVAQQYGYAASGEQVRNIATMIGKVMDGQTGALKRYGFSFSKAEEDVFKFGTEAKKAALFARIVTDSVGNMNEELGKTDQGKIKQATDAIDGLKGVIGRTVIFIKGQFARAFMDNMPAIQSGVQGITDRLQQWAENGGIQGVINGMKSVLEVISDVWNVAAETYNFFAQNWTLIGPIVYGIAAGFVAYKLAVMGASLWTIIFGKETTFAAVKTTVMGTAAMVASGQIGIMTAAQRLFNAALKANPIGVIVTLLGLLVVAGTYVVQNWEQVKLAGMNTWNFIVGAAEWAVNMYLKHANFMVRVYKFAWDSIKFAGMSIWDGIISAGEVGVNGFIKLVEFMVEKTLNGVNGLIRGVNSMSSYLGLGDVMGELTFGGLGRVDFSGAKSNVDTPKWDNSFNLIPDVNFSGAKFGEDSIMKQTQKAQSERDKKKGKSENDLAMALNQNVAALNSNTSATGENTGATNKNTATLKGNQSATDIADSLLGRIERHLYAT